MDIFPVPVRASENLVSRDRFGRSGPGELAHSPRSGLNLVLPRGPLSFLPLSSDGRLPSIPSAAIGSVPILSGHAKCLSMALTAESPRAQG